MKTAAKYLQLKVISEDRENYHVQLPKELAKILFEAVKLKGGR